MPSVIHVVYYFVNYLQLFFYRFQRIFPKSFQRDFYYMTNKQDNNLVVGLDIGTTKVVALVGEVTADDNVEIIGVGTHPSRGLKRGMVVNIDTTVHSIKHAIEEAELMAGCKINSAYTGIAGGHIKSLNSHGIVAIRGGEVQQDDIDRVVDAAKTVAIPADQKMLHVLPQEFIIDNQEGVRDPIGMSGVRLESKVHIVTGSVSAVQNIVKCIERCGLQVSDIILQQLASSDAVLTDDEKELGVCLIDIGGGTTDIAVFHGGAIRHTAIIPIAGDQVTNDIAVTLHTPTKYAEEIKIKYASVLEDGADESITIEVPTGGRSKEKEVTKKTLAAIVGARYEELFTLVLAELRRSGFADFVPAGVVVTGGASKVEGLLELAVRSFKMPVRLGSPQNISGMIEVLNNPIYSTGVGLLLVGYRNQQDGKSETIVKPGIRGLWKRMKGWFQGNF
jgi:cell division protein FtsA